MVHINSASAASCPSTSCHRLEFPQTAHVAYNFDFQDELIPRADRTLEAGAINAHKIVNRILVRFGTHAAKRYQGRSLCHRFNDQHTGALPDGADSGREKKVR